jgi:hypothetical protein
MSLPRQLLSYINSGKCFALIGSGLSSAMNYPSWWQMATDAAALLPAADAEQKVLTKLIEQKDYPEVFQRVAHRLGGVPALLDTFTLAFTPKTDPGEAYQHVCRWPFRCYLTTNYDDEIDKHLKSLKHHFTTLNNSQADLAQISGDSQRRIVKLHGDLTTPDDIVLTTSQYKLFETGGARQYFRNKLISIFQMVPVVVIGHSMTDRDLQLILQLAKESVAPDMPIYMLVADAAEAEVEKLHREFNIRILSYPNPKGANHKNLIQLLRQINRFVVPRTADTKRLLDPPDAREAEVAVSLYVHSSLNFGADAHLIQRTIQPQLLSIAVTSPEPIDATHVASLLKPDSLSELPSIGDEVGKAIAALRDKGMIAASGPQLTATKAGADALAEIRSKRKAEEDQFFGAIAARLQPHGKSSQVTTLVEGFKGALVSVFRKRGLAAAELLFRENPFEPADMPELFESVFPPATAVEDFTLRAEYCEAVMDVLTKPNDDQKAYLANLAQGFFAYHMFGIDPDGREVRRRLVQGTAWILDSNVVMPLVAKHSVQWSFVDGLLHRMLGLGIKPATTPQLVSEVDRALGWMQRHLNGVPDGEERAALLHLIGQPGYSENPFVDGFISGHASGAWRSWTEFLDAIGYVDGVGLRKAIEQHGIEILNPAAILTAEEIPERDALADTITKERQRVGTLRGDLQVNAEAEALQLIRAVRRCGFRGDAEATRAFFVGTSRLLDVLYARTDGLLTWFPETLFKHLSYVDAAAIDADAVFHAITTSYYSVGISIIEEDAYRQYFKPAITEANATLKREVGAYAKAVTTSVGAEQRERDSILARFGSLSDLEKPQFVAQLGWITARRTEARLQLAVKARVEADERRKTEVEAVKQEYERKRKETERHEAGRRRNLADPKHQRKRRNQAKKRRRKGR